MTDEEKVAYAEGIDGDAVWNLLMDSSYKWLFSAVPATQPTNAYVLRDGKCIFEVALSRKAAVAIWNFMKVTSSP
jgi:hypothetical protein